MLWVSRSDRTVRGACGNVALDVVIPVDKPESSRSCVAGQADKVLTRVSAEVSGDDIFRFQPILNKEGVPTRLKCDVILDTQVVYTMDGDSPVICVVNGIAPAVRVLHCANHVKVDRVAANTSHLARVSQLKVFETRGERLSLRAV